MARGSIRLLPALILVHRWAGVGLWGLFLLWFPSGLVMMYRDYPSVTAEDRLARADVLNAQSVRLSPSEAWARSGLKAEVVSVRLNVFDRRPVYRFRAGGGERMVFADSGEGMPPVTRELAARVAAAWTGQTAGRAEVQDVVEPDQWTVGGALRTMRPLWKYSWPNGEQVYVSGRTGEVVQYTTRSSRLWAYLGAIPHWLYFTPLRRYPAAWSRVVIWTAGAGTATSILGLGIGLWVWRVGKKIPYAGQKRWHLILGLIFGPAVVTWVFSGMLSMDPFGAPARSGIAVDVGEALRGRVRTDAFGSRTPAEVLQGLAVKELELTSFGGEPVYVATASRSQVRIIPVHGDASEGFGAARVMEVLRKTVTGANVAELRLLSRYDAYYTDRRGARPLPVVLLRAGDAAGTRYYVDPATARVVASYSSRAWVTRWLYHGLHSLQLPGLSAYRPLWEAVMILLLAGGTALCVTSAVLAWRTVTGGRKQWSSSRY